MKLKQILKAFFHRHNFSLLLIYPPHSHVCNQPQCAESNNYGFLLRCDCGYTTLTKLPTSIKEVFAVESGQSQQGSKP